MKKLKWNRLVWFFQRIRHGISDYDLMDFDMWFLCHMPKFLKRFKGKHHGVPVGYFEEDFYNLIKDKIDEEAFEKILNHEANAYSIGYGDEYDKYLNDKWNETLDRMIFLFNECNKDDQRNEYQKKCFKEAMALFIKFFDGLWW